MKRNAQYHKNVIILGGGACGLLAGITAGRTGASVAILEHNARVGKKILATGNGRCNLTNLALDPAAYHCGNAEVLTQVLGRFSVEDTLNFFHEIGVLTTEKNGWVYPVSNQATTVLDALRFELNHLHNVTVITDYTAERIEKRDNGFIVHGAVTEKGTLPETYRGDTLIVAVGGLASPKSGSDGSAYPLIKSLGHRFRSQVPGLTGLRCAEDYFKSIAGVRAQGRVTLWVDDTSVAQEQGEIQFTNSGISGIPVFQICRTASYGVKEKAKVRVTLDLFPEKERDWLKDELTRRIQRFGSRTVEELLCGFLHKKLIFALCKLSGLQPSSSVLRADEASWNRFLDYMKALPATIIESQGFENAQVTAGGILLEDVRAKDLSSIEVEGLYFAGEVLDIDGPCGGYNLQWAWSSGYVTGKAAAERSLHDSRS